jgi:hypothetical protein
MHSLCCLRESVAVLSVWFYGLGLSRVALVQVVRDAFLPCSNRVMLRLRLLLWLLQDVFFSLWAALL